MCFMTELALTNHAILLSLLPYIVIKDSDTVKTTGG